jgi:hypothetical protein
MKSELNNATEFVNLLVPPTTNIFTRKRQEGASMTIFHYTCPCIFYTIGFLIIRHKLLISCMLLNSLSRTLGPKDSSSDSQ